MKTKRTDEEKFNTWAPVAIKLCDPYKESHHYEDLKQEAVLALWERYCHQGGSIKIIISVYTLKRALEVVFKSFFKRNRDWESEQQDVASPFEILIKKERLANTHQIISQFPEREKDFVYRRSEGQTFRKIAEKLTISRNRVDQIEKDQRKLIKKTIKNLDEKINHTTKFKQYRGLIQMKCKSLDELHVLEEKIRIRQSWCIEKEIARKSLKKSLKAKQELKEMREKLIEKRRLKECGETLCQK